MRKILWSCICSSWTEPETAATVAAAVAVDSIRLSNDETLE